MSEPSWRSRIRWANVARLAALLGVLALVLSWPRLGGAPVTVPAGRVVPVVAAPPRAVQARPVERRAVVAHRARRRRRRRRPAPRSAVVARRPVVAPRAPAAAAVSRAPARPPARAPSAAAIAAEEFGLGS
jgi:hypothetical protein